MERGYVKKRSNNPAQAASQIKKMKKNIWGKENAKKGFHHR